MALTDTIEIAQGDSSQIFKLRVTNHSELNEDWKCILFVVKKTGLEDQEIYKELDIQSDETGSFFVGMLEPLETEDLLPSSYVLGFEISNKTLKYRKEILYKLKITKPGLVN